MLLFSIPYSLLPQHFVSSLKNSPSRSQPSVLLQWVLLFHVSCGQGVVDIQQAEGHISDLWWHIISTFNFANFQYQPDTLLHAVGILNLQIHTAYLLHAWI